MYFFQMLIQSLVIMIFGKEISNLCEILLVFAGICYVFAVFELVGYLSKKKILKSFLKRVSFLAFGRHIEIVGLLDTGNVLYDSKTNLPVIVLSVFALKNFLPSNIYKNITIGDFSELGVNHYLECVSVAEKTLSMPIIKIDSATIICGDKSQKVNCVLGIVNHRFEGSNEYDCLLHRDFV